MDKIGDVAKEILITGLGAKIDKETGEIITLCKDDDTCLNCGTRFTWAEKQFRRDCPECGISIERINRGGMMPSVRSCGICSNGFIIFKYQYGGILSESAARCMCPLGDEQDPNVPNILNAEHAPERYRRIFGSKPGQAPAGERGQD